MTSMCAALSLFADNELPGEVAQAFRGHLGGCASCQRELHDVILLDVLVEDYLASPADLNVLKVAERE